MTWRFLTTIAAIASCAVAFPQAKTDLIAVEAFASDEIGNPITPELGSNFFTTLKFKVQGMIRDTYVIRIDTPYEQIQTPALQFGQGAPGEYSVTWGTIPIVTDKAIPVTVTIVSGRKMKEASTRNNSFKFTLNATKPAAGAEWYGLQSLRGEMNVSLEWLGAQPQNMSVWLPQISTSSFQQVYSVSNPAWFSPELSAAFNAPLVSGAPEDTLTSLLINQTFYTEAASLRINRDVLRNSTFADYANESPELAEWVKSETLIQTNNRDLQKFSDASLKRIDTSRPFDVAEALYLAVLKRVNYLHTPGNVPSALQAFKTRKADCGGLSALFVALCRIEGIPARPVAGFTMGSNEWHVWAEFFVPNHGWIAVDPAYAEGLDGSGSMPLYFGVVPDLNSRAATSFGFEKTVGSRTVGFIQAPTLFWSNTQAQATNVSSTCSLTLAN